MCEDGSIHIQIHNEDTSLVDGPHYSDWTQFLLSDYLKRRISQESYHRLVPELSVSNLARKNSKICNQEKLQYLKLNKN